LQQFVVATGVSVETTDQEKANWIDAYVDLIDPQIFASLTRGRGSKPHPPAQMFKLAIYQILKRHLSPAKWAREVLSDTILQGLIGRIIPSRTALYNFCDRIGKIIDQINQSLILQSIKYEILAPTVGVLDGTSVRSYGSRHRIVNQKTLRRRRNELNDAIIRDLQGDIQTTLPAWMGTTASGRSSQRDCYDKAGVILAQRIEENGTKRKTSRRSLDKIYICLSDPEAGLSRDKENVFCPMYCGQLLTDSKSSLILGSELSNRITDVGTIGPMLDQVESGLGVKLAQVHADAAYSSLMDLQACAARHVELIAPVQANGLTKEKKSKKADTQLSRDQFQFDAATHTYTCPAGHPMPYYDRDNRKRVGGVIVMERFRQDVEKCQACPLAKQCLRGAKQRSIGRPIGYEIVEQQIAKMTDELAAESRVLRAQTIERTNADIKQRIGVRRFGVTTLKRAKNFLALTVFVLNIMTVRRLLHGSSPVPTTT
jgi:hypothetical protein